MSDQILSTGVAIPVSGSDHKAPNTIIGHGNVPPLKAFRALKRSGCDGVLSVEFEGMEDPLVGVRIGRANRRWLVELAQAVFPSASATTSAKRLRASCGQSGACRCGIDSLPT